VSFFSFKLTNQSTNINAHLILKATSNTTNFVLLMAALVLAQCNRTPGPEGAGADMQMPPAQVTLAPVEEKRLVEWREFTGRVEAMETVELRPRVSGYLDEVHFEAGQLVEKEQKLFTIDKRAFETRLAQAAAELRRAEVAVMTSKKEFDRVKALLEAKALSPEQADTRESAYLQAMAALEGAKAAQRSAEIELSHTEVKAPISGRIGRAMVTPGNYVSGMPGGASLLTTIVTVNPVFVYVDIDENSLIQMQKLRREGKMLMDARERIPVRMQLSGESGFPHEGFIESFDNRLDAGTGSLVVRAQFEDKEGQLTPGLFARVEIPMTAEYPALLVEDSAILTDQANKYVLGVNGQNLTEYRPVVLGPSHEGKRIVRSGLKKGERVIVNGQARLPMPGMPVAPVEAGAGGAEEKKGERAAAK
jgi:RND family efflux transporter MFP subunit